MVSLLALDEMTPPFAIGASLFFSYATCRGVHLWRFFGTELELDESSATLRKNGMAERLPLATVRFKFEDWIEIVSVYDL